MTTNSETGHAKNAANFKSLISFVKGYGEIYNPTNDSIKLESLETMLGNVEKSLSDVDNASPAYTNAVSIREVTFAPLSKLSTRVINALKATNTAQQVDESARTLIRKIQGKRATPKMTEAEKAAAITEGKEINQISSSQMSYDNRLENFYKLIMLLASIPEYKPNEEELKITSLTAVYEDLKAKNTAVVESITPLSNTRILRNEIMYKPLSGMVDTTYDVKIYVKSLFGATSPQYRQVSRLVFKPRDI